MTDPPHDSTRAEDCILHFSMHTQTIFVVTEKGENVSYSRFAIQSSTPSMHFALCNLVSSRLDSDIIIYQPPLCLTFAQNVPSVTLPPHPPASVRLVDEDTHQIHRRPLRRKSK